jgi:hypothetical protein
LQQDDLSFLFILTKIIHICYISSTMYRTDLLTHDMNQIKKDQLLDLLKVYQKTAVKIADAHWKLFNLNSRENNKPDFDKYSKEITGIQSILNTMYKQMCNC